jgi:hypothetical protein
MGEMTELNPNDPPSTLEELSLLAGSRGSVILSRAPQHDEFGVEMRMEPSPCAEEHKAL